MKKYSCGLLALSGVMFLAGIALYASLWFYAAQPSGGNSKINFFANVSIFLMLQFIIYVIWILVLQFIDEYRK